MQLSFGKDLQLVQTFI